MEQVIGKMKWVIFTEEMPGKVPIVLVDAFLTEIASRSGMETVAVCVRENSQKAPLPSRKKWRHFFKHLFGRHHAKGTLGELLHRHGVTVIHPPENDVNHPDLLRQWQEMGVTHGVSIYCLQKFSPQLLSCFHAVGNYHNGLLPFYRGVRATSWSIYQGEKETGYTWHLMTPQLDAGPILIQGAIPIPENAHAIALDHEKAILASHRIAQVIDLLKTAHPGHPQSGKGSYYSRRHQTAIENIDPYGSLTSEEILKRLRAFGKLFVILEGKKIPFRKLREVPSKTGNPCIHSDDGVWFEIVT